MKDRIFLAVDALDWVYGTIEKVQRGVAWSAAWRETYREVGGRSDESGRKGCPMAAARTLYEFGRIRDGGMPFLECDIVDLWPCSRNGTYAMLAIRLLRDDPALGKARLWRGIQEAVRRETGDEPALSNQGGPTLAFLLWGEGVIVEPTH